MFILTGSLTYGWSINISSPTGSSTCPGRYYYQNSGTFNVTFSLSGISERYDYYVNLKKDGNTIYTSSTGNTSNSNPVTVQIPYSVLCYNNNMEIQVYAYKHSGSSDNQSSSVFAVVYTNLGYMGCSSPNIAVVNGSETHQSSYQLGTFYHGWSCGVSAGTYAYKRYKVEWTVYGDFTNKSILINDGLTLGYNGAIPNYQYTKGYVGTVTSTSAHFYTFVYELKSSMNGTYLGFYPCAPSEAAIVYTVVSNPAPVISGFNQTPTIIYPGSSGTVVCNLSQGNCCNIGYSWSYSNKPSYVTVTFSGNTATIHNNHSYDNINMNIMAPEFGLTCTATNSYGSDTKYFGPLLSTNGGGCPWLFVQSDDYAFVEENNILHRSEFPENADEDITDMYKLNTVPLVSDDNEIQVKIVETGRKYSYFDRFRMYVVDHSNETEVGVTEDNQIVLYTRSNVVSTDTANFNDTLDVTDQIQYPFVLEGDALEGDTLMNAYVHYPANSFKNFAMITSMDYDRIVPISKWFSADATCYTNEGVSSKSFAMRELSHEVIVPFDISSFSTVSVNNINLAYQRHFSVKYIALAPISNVNSYEEATLNSVVLSGTGDITQFAENTDQLYCEMDSLSTLTLKFDMSGISALGKNKVRDYIFVSVGRYVDSNPNDNSDGNYSLLRNTGNDPSRSLPLQYKLYTNYPNPFNPMTLIKYDIKYSGLVKVRIFNATGQLVTELVNEIQNAGSYEVAFDGSGLASGVYFYKLEAGDFAESKKMVLIK